MLKEWRSKHGTIYRIITNSFDIFRPIFLSTNRLMDLNPVKINPKNKIQSRQNGADHINVMCPEFTCNISFWTPARQGNCPLKWQKQSLRLWHLSPMKECSLRYYKGSHLAPLQASFLFCSSCYTAHISLCQISPCGRLQVRSTTWGSFPSFSITLLMAWKRWRGDWRKLIMNNWACKR